MEQIRIMIADDHPAVRAGLRQWLSDMPQFRVIAETGDSQEAVTMAIAKEPDIVLMDIRMPPIGGIEATRRILATHPAIKVIIVSMYDDLLAEEQAREAHAKGYVVKNADQDDFARAIEVVARGSMVFQSFTAADTLNLTPREHEVAEQIAQGRERDEIAEMFAMKPHYVENLFTQIFSKLQVANRFQALVRLREIGFGHRYD